MQVRSSRGIRDTTTGVVTREWLGSEDVERRMPVSGGEAWHAVRSDEGKRSLVRSATIVLIVGLAIRFALAPFTSLPYDVMVWYRTAASGVHGVSPYTLVQFPYPPLWGVFLQALGKLLFALGIPISHWGTVSPQLESAGPFALGHVEVITAPVFNIAFRSVLFAFDAGTAYLLYLMALRLTGSRRRGLFAASAWFLNPFVIYESAVHGAFDTIVAFFVIATVALVMSKRYVAAGSALALGALAKVAPLFLVPVIVAVVLMRPGPSDRRERFAEAVRALGGLALGGLCTGAVALVPLVARGELGGMLHNTFSRVSTGAAIGGLNPYGWKNFLGFGWLRSFATAHRPAIGTLTLFAQVAASVGVAVWAGRVARRRPSYALLAGCTISLLIVLFTGPLTNPQFLLWPLPLMIIMAAVYGRARVPLVLLSGVPVVVLLGLGGPLSTMGPLAVYTHLLRPAYVARSATAWGHSAGLLSSTLPGALIAAGAVVAAAAYAFAIVSYVRGHSSVRASAGRRSRGAGRKLGRVAMACAVVVVLALGSAEMVVYGLGPPARGEGTAQLVGARWDATGVNVVLRLVPPVGTEAVNLAAVPLARSLPSRNIRVFIDPRYPLATSTNGTIVNGLFDHLRAELALRGYPGAVTQIRAGELARTFRDLGDAPRTMVVIGTGVFPSSVLSKSVDLVRPWLHHGGILAWAGGQIGWYEATAGSGLSLRSPANLGRKGSRLVLGRSMYDRPRTRSEPLTGAETSRTGAALGIQYARIDCHLRASSVLAGGGQILGSGDGRYVSLASIPVNRGTVILFGGWLTDEQATAHDLALITLTGVTAHRGTVLARSLDLGHLGPQGAAAWHIPVAPGVDSIVLSALDPAVVGTYFARFELSR